MKKQGQVITLSEWIEFVKRTHYEPVNPNGYLYYLLGEPTHDLTILNEPVVDISIDDARAFCQSNAYELPTTEYASLVPKAHRMWFWAVEGESVFTIGNGITYYSRVLGMDLRYPFGDIANTYPIYGEPYRSSTTGLYAIPKESQIVSSWMSETEDELF